MVRLGFQVQFYFDVEHSQSYGKAVITHKQLARGRAVVPLGGNKSLLMTTKMLSFQLTVWQVCGTRMVLSELWLQGSILFEFPLEILVCVQL